MAAQVMPAPAIPVVSVGNLKGGVGKTSVVANLATALVRAGLRVLAIDLDFQASLSVAFLPAILPRNETSDGGVNILLGSSYHMFHDSQVTSRGIGVYSDLSLVRTSLELAKVEDMLFSSFILGKEKRDPRFALSRKLIDPQLQRDFDIVLIDTPPRLTMASMNAFCASTHVLIPTALTPMAQSGALTFVEYLRQFQNSLCPRLNILAVLPTLTRAQFSPGELRPLEDALRDIPIWADFRIPYRQGIADNKVLTDQSLKRIFDALALKVLQTLQLKPNGANEGIGTYRSTHPSR